MNDAWKQLAALVPLTLPIVQAPMAGVSSPAMASAVSKTGALGSIGIGASSVDDARAMIRAASRPLNVNVFCHAPAHRDAAREKAWIERLTPELARYGATPPSELREIYRSFVVDDAMLAMLIEEKPAVVSFHFGMPHRERIETLRAAGIVLFGTATSLDEARALVAAGVQVVVAQGWEAGGHRGTFDPDAPDARLGTRALVSALVEWIDVSVIAAGGIMDGAGIYEVMRLGAAAAQLGTAFAGCDESLADAGYRAALFSAKETVMTRTISGRPARCLPNRFTAIDGTDAPAYPVAYDLGKALAVAARGHGEFGFGAQWAGTGAASARKGSATEIVRSLVAELERT